MAKAIAAAEAAAVAEAEADMDPAKARVTAAGVAVARGAHRSYDQPRGFLMTRSPSSWSARNGLRFKRPAKPLFPLSHFARAGPPAKPLPAPRPRSTVLCLRDQ
jgi:hypothetical protein